MNQYDFADSTAPPSGFVKTARAVAFAVIALACLAGCGDKDPLPTPANKIEGFWIGGAWNHETNRYYFHDGAAWVDKYSNGVFQGREDYAYFVDDYTLRLTDISTLTRFDYVASFPTDTTARLYTLPLGIEINLKRI